MKISPNPSLPSGPEALWAGGQRGGIPPFGKGRWGGILKGLFQTAKLIRSLGFEINLQR
jgi:hypothetical protein